ncbi:MAG: type 2 isopentenyl-diphosphate Delta-isomerase [Chitinophagales bacterium]|nr:type 2 isopentenyl-diphosphate Delta-isomerase [Chitinophagales bacterium]
MTDPTAENRKKDHLALALNSQTDHILQDTRFYYEPLLAAHPKTNTLPVTFLGKQLNLPLWISSMTGGTEKAGKINRNLAQACRDFGIGMGLGSCRGLLESDKHLEDFNLRPLIGSELPFFANLGIAQVEKLMQNNEVQRIVDLVDRLQADGLIIHINPLQEWLQPEGDRFMKPPLETIRSFLPAITFPVIVKEVGQGMGPVSIKEILQLPIAAFDFGAYGGTNFSKLELLRSVQSRSDLYDQISYIGHTAEEMVGFVNDTVEELGDKVKCKEIIVSGGIKNFLDGYYCIRKLKLNSIYAQGSAMLSHAQNSYDELRAYVQSQADGLALSNSYLKIRI